jgi:hypothetical protein
MTRTPSLAPSLAPAGLFALGLGAAAPAQAALETGAQVVGLMLIGGLIVAVPAAVVGALLSRVPRKVHRLMWATAVFLAEWVALALWLGTAPWYQAWLSIPFVFAALVFAGGCWFGHALVRSGTPRTRNPQ